VKVDFPTERNGLLWSSLKKNVLIWSENSLLFDLHTSVSVCHWYHVEAGKQTRLAQCSWICCLATDHPRFQRHLVKNCLTQRYIKSDYWFRYIFRQRPVRGFASIRHAPVSFQLTVKTRRNETASDILRQLTLSLCCYTHYSCTQWKDRSERTTDKPCHVT